MGVGVFNYVWICFTCVFDPRRPWPATDGAPNLSADLQVGSDVLRAAILATIARHWTLLPWSKCSDLEVEPSFITEFTKSHLVPSIQRFNCHRKSYSRTFQTLLSKLFLTLSTEEKIQIYSYSPRKYEYNILQIRYNPVGVNYMDMNAIRQMAYRICIWPALAKRIPKDGR